MKESATTEPVSSLYILKALLAFFVVCCHAPLDLPWISFPGLFTDLFFTITGYFLYSHDWVASRVRIAKSLKKVLPITIILRLLYEVPMYLVHGVPSLSDYRYWIPRVVLGFSFDSTVHLWYLTALVFGLVFFSWYLRRLRGRWISLLFLLILPGVLIDYPFQRLLFSKTETLFIYNFLTRAVPFLAMGYWIRMHEASLLRFRWLNIYFLLMVLSAMEMILWGWITHWVYFPSLLSVFPLRFAFFMLCLGNKKLGRGTWLETIGRDYSGNIYYFHMAVIIAWVSLDASSPQLTLIYDKAGALIVFLISLGVAYGIVKLQDRVGYHLFR